MIYNDLIDRYIKEEMNPSEKDFFEEQMKDNNDLAKQVRLWEDISKAISENDVLNLRNQLDYIHFELYPQTLKTKRLLSPFFLQMASAISGIAIISSVFFVTLKTKDSYQLYKEYYAPYASTVRTRSANNIDDEIVKAMALYDKGEFNEAISFFENILEENKSNNAIFLYAGISYLENNDFTHAEHAFGNILNDKSSPYKEQAEWYLGLSYLKSGMNKKAYELFKIIAGNEGYYSKKAKKIYRKIKLD